MIPLCFQSASILLPNLLQSGRVIPDPGSLRDGFCSKPLCFSRKCKSSDPGSGITLLPICFQSASTLLPICFQSAFILLSICFPICFPRVLHSASPICFPTCPLLLPHVVPVLVCPGGHRSAGLMVPRHVTGLRNSHTQKGATPL